MRSKTIEDLECDQKHFELADGLGISHQYHDGMGGGLITLASWVC